jgi:hypothetical protein
MTEVELELLTDPDMYLFIEEGLRGRISMISNRFSKANNPYVPDYDPDEDSSYIMYLDANSIKEGNNYYEGYSIFIISTLCLLLIIYSDQFIRRRSNQSRARWFA